LFAPKDQQLGIGRKDLTQSVLKDAAGFDAPTDVVHPLNRNSFDTTLALGHEGEKPDGMALAGSTMASGFAAAAVSERQRPRQKIFGKGKLAEARKLLLTEPGGFRTFGADFHLKAIMHSE
jgi:hypothetical protein